MAKPDKAAAAPAAAAAEASESAQGTAVVLPNGERRIDYIRNHYYSDGKDGSPKKMNRSEIRVAINEMYKNAGQEGKTVAYQIIFQATKAKTDPRVKAAAAS